MLKLSVTFIKQHTMIEDRIKEENKTKAVKQSTQRFVIFIVIYIFLLFDRTQTENWKMTVCSWSTAVNHAKDATFALMEHLK